MRIKREKYADLQKARTFALHFVKLLFCLTEFRIKCHENYPYRHLVWNNNKSLELNSCQREAEKKQSDYPSWFALQDSMA